MRAVSYAEWGNEKQERAMFCAFDMQQGQKAIEKASKDDRVRFTEGRNSQPSSNSLDIQMMINGRIEDLKARESSSAPGCE